ncbi:MAG: HlyD family type I secretion periplasmic adaptor subunit [Desulfovibrio sp.]|nr:MAG: HlyD family type I secretion periplasmic adaptor subunit [Desulfovibrio sp.]
MNGIGNRMKALFRSPSRSMWLLCVAALALALAWAVLGRVDRTSTAWGEVVPSGRVRRVEHLEGGIVSEILVREGDQVQQGDVLLVLEETHPGADLEEIVTRMDLLALEQARLQAEANAAEGWEDGPGPEFPDEARDRHPDFTALCHELYLNRMIQRENELSAQELAVQGARHDVERFEARIGPLEQALALVNEQVAISSNLLAEDLTTELKHLELLRERSNLSGSMEETLAELAEANAALAEEEERFQRIDRAFQEQTTQQLAEVRQELAELEQRHARYSDSMARTLVRSPVAGVVQAMAVTARGEVVEPGETVALIVPLGEALVIEANVPVSDIGYVAVGQEATIKLAGQDAGRFSGLPGRVLSVSPSAVVDSGGGIGYLARIEANATAFMRDNERYDLYPGLPVVVTIHTGHWPVLTRLLAPLSNAWSQALGER